jgi:hypothetical protein
MFTPGLQRFLSSEATRRDRTEACISRRSALEVHFVNSFVIVDAFVPHPLGMKNLKLPAKHSHALSGFNLSTKGKASFEASYGR